MMDFESCHSLEKLVLDNEICGMTLRIAKGIEPREDFPAVGHLSRATRPRNTCSSPSTLDVIFEKSITFRRQSSIGPTVPDGPKKEV